MGVDIQTVDNFQGQENDVVIISCVRSNKQQTAGFTKVANRTNVALSRARQAMFVIGDFEMLKAKGEDNCWKKIYEVAEAEGAFTDGTIEIGCQQHATYRREIDILNSDALMQFFPKGGCPAKCGGTLSCGHKCKWECHDPKYHESDEYIQCKEPCIRQCVRGHTCKELCYVKCPPCPIKLERFYFEYVFPCNCTEKIPCGTDFQYWQCQAIKRQVLSCGHEIDIKCSLPTKDWRCDVEDCAMRKADEVADRMKQLRIEQEKSNRRYFYTDSFPAKLIIGQTMGIAVLKLPKRQFQSIQKNTGFCSVTMVK